MKEEEPASANGSERQGSTVGTLSIGEFHEANGPWEDYIERFDFLSTAQGIVDDVEKRAMLLAGIGQDAYRLIKSVLAPLSPTEVSYADVVKAVQRHLAPKQSVIISRFKFHRKVQEPRQNIKDFVAELKSLAVPCEFGAALDWSRVGLVISSPCSSVEERWTCDPCRWWQPGSRRFGGSLFASDRYGLRSVAVAVAVAAHT